MSFFHIQILHLNYRIYRLAQNNYSNNQLLLTTSSFPESLSSKPSNVWHSAVASCYCDSKISWTNPFIIFSAFIQSICDMHWHDISALCVAFMDHSEERDSQKKVIALLYLWISSHRIKRPHRQYSVRRPVVPHPWRKGWLLWWKHYCQISTSRHISLHIIIRANPTKE